MVTFIKAIEYLNHDLNADKLHEIALVIPIQYKHNQFEIAHMNIYIYIYIYIYI